MNHTSSDLADFRPPAWPSHYHLWNSTVDDSCFAANADAPWFCMLANNSLPYISSEVFITEAQTDQVVLAAHDWVPVEHLMEAPEQAYLARWAANMTQVRGEEGLPLDGPLWLASLATPHCLVWLSLTLDRAWRR